MTCVFETERTTIFGAPVEIDTFVSAPYGDASLAFYLVLSHKQRILLSLKSERNVVELGENKNIHALSAEDKSILLSSAQHNLDLQGEQANVYETIKKISELFAIEPDGVPF